MLLCTHRTFFGKFHMVCASQPSKTWLLTSVQSYITLFDLPPFWTASKKHFFEIKTIFVEKTIPKNEFSSLEKILKKKIAFFKKFPELIEWPA